MRVVQCISDARRFYDELEHELLEIDGWDVLIASL